MSAWQSPCYEVWRYVFRQPEKGDKCVGWATCLPTRFNDFSGCLKKEISNGNYRYFE
ncbi:MAG: hypothetical protein J6U05_07040 [Neisseriaceae bacterium]|nr:hypothetical protein [Neisseriaceae bacterium]MBO7554810.1 hypothetical protein [Neisseriaceae bacterium]